MRSLRPCSDSSATPSFPSQPEGKIGLPRANPRGPRLTGHSQENSFSSITLVPLSRRGSHPVQGSKARQAPLLPSPPSLLHRASHQQPQTLLLITSCKSTLCGEMGRTGWGQGGKVMAHVSSPHSDSARTPGEDPTSLACIHMYGCTITI